MSKRIFKYELGACERQTLSLPVSSTLLSVASQNGHLVLWAEVDTDLPERNFEFAVCCTGEESPESYTFFLGTVQISELVFHVFALN